MAPSRIDSPPLTDPIPTTGPLTGAQNMALCKGCTRCCTYVAVEIDPPDVPWMYDQYAWMLDHRGVWMYLETGNHWYVQFETVCEQLEDAGTCRIYGRHPVLCKEYDARSCERRGVLVEIKARFYKGEELLRWVEARRPAHYRRYREWFDAQHAPAAVGAKAGAASGAAPEMERYEMPEAPVSPLTLRRSPSPAAAPRKS